MDFKLGRCHSPEDEMRLLATDDLEVGLRRLAAYMYEARTRDTVGARQMLALHAPGGMHDIAPAWMVETATT